MVNILFSLGEGLSFFQRFVFYLDHKGVQDIRGPGRKRFARLGLRDLSYTLRKTDEAKDWTAPAVFAYSVVCDKTQPEKSLVHGIARRAGLGVSDIDCSTVPVTLPYVRLRKNIWAELSSLATARYRIKEAGGRERAVIFADGIDTREEAENRLEYDGGAFAYSFYDVTTHHDRAVLALTKEYDGDLYNASIFGKPIVLDLNRSCFLTDREGVAAYGTAALNVTGSYFSEYEVNGRPQYEDWVMRELAGRVRNGREFAVKTHRGLFNARVGAKVRVALRGELLKGTVAAFHLRYRKNKAFQSGFRITEETGNES